MFRLAINSCMLFLIITLVACSASQGVASRSHLQPMADEDNFQRLKTEGRLLGIEKKFFQAIIKLDQAALLRPNDVHVHLMLGEAHFHVGHGSESLAHLKKSRELAPNNYQVESWLGTIHIELGQLSEAEVAYSNVLALKPNDYNALVYMGYIAFHKKDYPTCQAYFKRYKRLIEVIEPTRLTEQEKRRYQQATEYYRACDASWRDETLKLHKTL
ncbi:MAG: hypothetical protein MRJ96_14340 [Nitrospirales bacterium]|nr:hypothetical protein [Nitrospira sp.]MDR4502621.1 hypothetical protein [Nitrospirales bacterium]